MAKNYIRDKRSPKPSSAIASKVFSSIKAKNTKPEIIVRQLLWENGFRGYRLHWLIPGRPDIVFTKKRIAIFIHGCYFHRCPTCALPLPKSNTEFWKTKFEKNIERDKLKEKLLIDHGWVVITLWGCEIKKHPEQVIQKIKQVIDIR